MCQANFRLIPLTSAIPRVSNVSALRTDAVAVVEPFVSTLCNERGPRVVITQVAGLFTHDGFRTIIYTRCKQQIVHD